MSDMGFKEVYLGRIVPKFIKEYGSKSVMEVPKLLKITLNMGVGEAKDNKGLLDKACDELAKISGQKPIITNARKSVSGFKIREGWPIGCKVTLRGKRMYDFLKRLIVVVLPRVQDFRGLGLKSFDSFGNYSFGIKEQTVFPEIEYDTVDAVRGLDVCITTSAKNSAMAQKLLLEFGFPLRVD